MDILTNISLFSGTGGLDLGARLVGGFRTVAYVEYDRYAQGVLMSRMRSGELDDAPIFEDVRNFDGRSLAGSIDVISGGFPCQDISVAGKRAGLKEGTRSGLWSEYARLIRKIRPRFVLAENVPGLLSVDDGGGFGTVLRDLAALGYDAQWRVFSAAEVGAPHLRERVWIVAHTNRDGSEIGRLNIATAGQSGGGRDHAGRSGEDDRRESDSRPHVEMEHPDGAGRERLGHSESKGASEPLRGSKILANTEGQRWEQRGPKRQGQKRGISSIGPGGTVPDSQNSESMRGVGKPGNNQASGSRWNHYQSGSHGDVRWWQAEPGMGRVVDGMAYRVDRLRCTGNGVVPKQSIPCGWARIREIYQAN